MSLTARLGKTAKKPQPLLGVYFRNKSCFSFGVKQKPVESTFSLIIDDGDVLCMNASAQVCIMMLRYITNC